MHTCPRVQSRSRRRSTITVFPRSARLAGVAFSPSKFVSPFSGLAKRKKVFLLGFQKEKLSAGLGRAGSGEVFFFSLVFCS